MYVQMLIMLKAEVFFKKSYDGIILYLMLYKEMCMSSDVQRIYNDFPATTNYNAGQWRRTEAAHDRKEGVVVENENAIYTQAARPTSPPY